MEHIRRNQLGDRGITCSDWESVPDDAFVQVADRITVERSNLTPSERRIAEAILADSVGGRVRYRR